MDPQKIDWGELEAIIDKHRGETWALIPLLQDIQETFGYIPEESIEHIAEALNLFPSQVQGVISFYAGLSLKPKGKYFTLETVACLGACFLAPAMMVNRAYFGKLSPPKVTSILAEYGKKKGED